MAARHAILHYGVAYTATPAWRHSSRGCAALLVHRASSSRATALTRRLLQVANDLGDGVQVLKVDVDENPQLSTQLQVRALARVRTGVLEWRVHAAGVLWVHWWVSGRAHGHSSAVVPWRRAVVVGQQGQPRHMPPARRSLQVNARPCPWELRRLQGRKHACHHAVADHRFGAARAAPLVWCAQIQGLPTMIFIGMDPEKPALRTEGLLPAETIKTIVANELK